MISLIQYFSILLFYYFTIDNLIEYEKQCHYTYTKGDFISIQQ
jgi:hypothetical protein